MIDQLGVFVIEDRHFTAEPTRTALATPSTPKTPKHGPVTFSTPTRTSRPTPTRPTERSLSPVHIPLPLPVFPQTPTFLSNTPPRLAEVPHAQSTTTSSTPAFTSASQTSIPASQGMAPRSLYTSLSANVASGSEWTPGHGRGGESSRGVARDIRGANGRAQCGRTPMDTIRAVLEENSAQPFRGGTARVVAGSW
jgi:hypothetical protein